MNAIISYQGPTADVNGDGVVDYQEYSAFISPVEEKIIGAGYRNIVKLDDETYAVLTDHTENIDGQRAKDYFRNYLKSNNISYGQLTGV